MTQPADLPLTHSSTLHRLLYEALAALGYDPAQIYKSAYGAQTPAPNAEQRKAHDLAPLFWQALPTLTQDAQIGLHLGEKMQPRPLDVVSYLQLASGDLRQALGFFVRYQHIISGGFSASLEEDGERARLIIDLNYQGFGSLAQQMECLALLISKHLAQLTELRAPVTAVYFRHAAPRKLSEHRRLWGFLPHFNAEHDVLEFPAALLDRPSRNAAPELLAVLTAHADQQLAALSGNSLLNRVRYWQHGQLGQGPCTLALCAQALGLSAPALQRSLQAQGSHFREQLEAVRRQRSRQLMQQGASIHEMARALGFSELSPFYRAFRRWWGCTPQQWHQLT